MIDEQLIIDFADTAAALASRLRSEVVSRDLLIPMRVHLKATTALLSAVDEALDHDLCGLHLVGGTDVSP